MVGIIENGGGAGVRDGKSERWELLGKGEKQKKKWKTFKSKGLPPTARHGEGKDEEARKGDEQRGQRRGRNGGCLSQKGGGAKRATRNQTFASPQPTSKKSLSVRCVAGGKKSEISRY